jgi:hypothetical protein
MEKTEGMRRAFETTYTEIYTSKEFLSTTKCLYASLKPNAPTLKTRLTTIHS